MIFKTEYTLNLEYELLNSKNRDKIHNNKKCQ